MNFSEHKISKELGRSINTILNEIRRSTTIQIKQGSHVQVYISHTGKSVYKKHRSNSCRNFKLLNVVTLSKYTVDKITNDSWSPDACVGEAIATGRLNSSQMVCTKTLYNYINLGFMDVKNTDLPMKLRRNIKFTRVKKHKKNLDASISQYQIDIDNRKEFGHWELDTVIGEKYKDDNILLTIVEHKTRYSVIIKAIVKTAPSVTDAINRVRNLFGEQFSQVFKNITNDNGSEFADLSTIESEAEANTKIYFTHPYSSFEKGTNECHNGLIRRFIPKGKSISDYSCDYIVFVKYWMNTLPIRILKYKTPEELFKLNLDQIYSI